MKILKLIRCLFQGGHKFKFRNNLHGDRAMVMGARSVWVCTQCQAVEYRKELHEENEVPEAWFDPAFKRETDASCTQCCAKKGEPHKPGCNETGIA